MCFGSYIGESLRRVGAFLRDVFAWRRGRPRKPPNLAYFGVRAQMVSGAELGSLVGVRPHGAARGELFAYMKSIMVTYNSFLSTYS